MPRNAIVVVLMGLMSLVFLSAGGFGEPANPAPPGKVEPKKAAKKGRAFGDLLDAAARRRIEEAKAPMKAEMKMDRGGQDAEAAALQQFEQQFGSHMQRLYKGELSWMRRICQPTKQQYDKIAADTAPALKAANKRLAILMFRGGPVDGNQSFDIRKPLVESMTKAVRTTLSAEQAEAYGKEIGLRAAARKRMAVLNHVAKIDKLLVLTAEQRQQLGDILDNNWNESWAQLQLLAYGGNHLGPMPDAKILPILTLAQKNVWRGVQKGQVHYGWGSDLHVIRGMMQGQALDEELWDEEPASDKPAKAAVEGIRKAEEKR